MVAFHNRPFDTDQHQSSPWQESGGGPWHIADVLGELFERLPLSAVEGEPQEIEEPVAA